MKIIFESLIKNQSETPTNVKYETEAKYIYEKNLIDNNHYHTFTFNDNDKEKTITRIEINENFVNIFRGKTSLFFEVNKTNNKSLIYVDNTMSIPVLTKLNKVIIDDKLKEVHYSLMSLDTKLLGDFEIKITHE